MIAGGNAGIGRAAANGLAGMGATIHILCRSREKGMKAVEEIKDSTNNPHVHLHVVDLSSKQQVSSAVTSVSHHHRCAHSHLYPTQIYNFATSFVKSGQPLHVLINNAATMCGERQVTSEGVETALATNLVGFVCLTKELLPVLEANAPARIINVVSAGMLAMVSQGTYIKAFASSLDRDGHHYAGLYVVVCLYAHRNSRSRLYRNKTPRPMMER